MKDIFENFAKFPVDWSTQNTVKGVETEPQILHASIIFYFESLEISGHWRKFSLISGLNIL